jgi:hypothetical protein
MPSLENIAQRGSRGWLISPASSLLSMIHNSSLETKQHIGSPYRTEGKEKTTAGQTLGESGVLSAHEYHSQSSWPLFC